LPDTGRSILRGLYRGEVTIGLAQIIVVVALLPWALVALCAAYLLAGKAHWSGPVAVGVPSLLAVIWLHRRSWARLRAVPAEYRRQFILMVSIVQVLAPLAALVLGVFIYRDLRAGP